VGILKNNIQLIFKLLNLNDFSVFLLIELACEYVLKEQYDCNLFKYKGL